MKCSECKFWVPDEIPVDGQCRREPPKSSIIPMPNQITGQMNLTQQSLVPKTSADFWCGEFQAKTFDLRRIEQRVDL